MFGLNNVKHPPPTITSRAKNQIIKLNTTELEYQTLEHSTIYYEFQHPTN